MEAPDQKPRWSAILEVQDPDGTRTRHPFRHPQVSIGRKRENDLMLRDDGVSSRHCEFVSDQGFFVVRDVGSQNGTFVNGARVKPEGKKLRDGDEVRIGGTRIRVAMQGDVKVPRAPLRFSPAVIAAIIGALLSLVIGLALHRRSQDQSARTAWLAGLQEEARKDPCALPALSDLFALDRQIAGRSFAIALAKGEVKIAAQDDRADRALLALYRDKLDAFGRLEKQLAAVQGERREAQARLLREGELFTSSRDRKLSQWASGIFGDRDRAEDVLLHAAQDQKGQTARLVALVEAVVLRHEAESASQLAHFHFGGDLKSARDACEAQAAKASTSAAAAFSFLDE